MEKEQQHEEIRLHTIGSEGTSLHEEHHELLHSGWARLKRILVQGVRIVAVFAVLLTLVSVILSFSTDRTTDAVTKIHTTKLTMDDVMGTNLPPDPGAAANVTIAGIDANTNGIRDDVELAIFKAYATSSKTRAVLLQYALALQMEFTQPIVNSETVIAVAQEVGRGQSCVATLLSEADLGGFQTDSRSLEELVAALVLNTQDRIEAQEDFYDDLDGPYPALEGDMCDISFSALPNDPHPSR